MRSINPRCAFTRSSGDAHCANASIFWSKPHRPNNAPSPRSSTRRVSYRATRVRSDRFPLRGLSVDVSIDEGLLRLDPLQLELSRGRLGGAVSINARQETPRVDMDVRLTNARIGSIITLSGQRAVTGPLAACA